MILDYNALGARIKKIRKEKGISQAKLAEAVHYSPPYISYIETGKKHPGLDVFVLIANQLKVSADELLVDSIENIATVCNHEFESLTADCSEYEMRVLIDMLKATKESLRKNKSFQNR